MKPRRVSSIHFDTEAGESSTATPRACMTRVYLACLCKSIMTTVASNVPCINRGRRNIGSNYHRLETSLCSSAGPQRKHQCWQSTQHFTKWLFRHRHRHMRARTQQQSVQEKPDHQSAVSSCKLSSQCCKRHAPSIACGSSPLAHLQHHRSWTPPGCHAWPHGRLQLLPAHKPL